MQLIVGGENGGCAFIDIATFAVYAIRLAEHLLDTLVPHLGGRSLMNSNVMPKGIVLLRYLCIASHSFRLDSKLSAIVPWLTPQVVERSSGLGLT